MKENSTQKEKKTKKWNNFLFFWARPMFQKKEEKKESRLKAATLCSPKSRRVKKN